MALKAYIKIGKLTGESMKKPRADKGYSDLLSVSLGGTCNWDFSQEQQPTRMVTFGGVSVTKLINGGTPSLLIGLLKEKKTKEIDILIEDDQGNDFFLQSRGNVILPERILFPKGKPLAIRRPGDGPASGARSMRSDYVVDRDRALLGNERQRN